MDTVIKKIMHDDSDDEIYEQAAEILRMADLLHFLQKRYMDLVRMLLMKRHLQRYTRQREDLLIIRLLCILLIRKI